MSPMVELLARIIRLFSCLAEQQIKFFTRLMILPSPRAKQQSEPDVSQGLREQIVNIMDDLVNEIAPDYLDPNPFFRFWL